MGRICCHYWRRRLSTVHIRDGSSAYSGVLVSRRCIVCRVKGIYRYLRRFVPYLARQQMYIHGYVWPSLPLKCAVSTSKPTIAPGDPSLMIHLKIRVAQKYLSAPTCSHIPVMVRIMPTRLPTAEKGALGSKLTFQTGSRLETHDFFVRLLERDGRVTHHPTYLNE